MGYSRLWQLLRIATGQESNFHVPVNLFSGWGWGITVCRSAHFITELMKRNNLQWTDSLSFSATAQMKQKCCCQR